MFTGSFSIKGADVFPIGTMGKSSFAVSDGAIAAEAATGAPEIDCSQSPFPILALPAFADIHVHLREPGFEYKETVATGTAAAAAGGFSDIFAMPNLKPVPDSPETLAKELEAIGRTATVRVHPYAAITKGQRGAQIADLEALAPLVAGFSDDGHGVQDAAILREAMLRAKALGKPIVAHCEVNSLLPPGGCVHDGEFARSHRLAGIPSESEWRMVERDIGLVGETGVQYHVCHVSTKESVQLVREAKKAGLPVSCETAPHYLLLTDDDLRDEGRFKMNPPIRGAADREALLEGVADGTIDAIATDHAPHSAEEKSGGLAGSLFGIVGLETAFPLCHSHLVEKGVLTLGTLVGRMAERPRAIFGMRECGFAPGDCADFTLVALGVEDAVNPEAFKSKGRATPFDGWPVSARVILTVAGGRVVHDNLASASIASPFGGK